MRGFYYKSEKTKQKEMQSVWILQPPKQKILNIDSDRDGSDSDLFDLDEDNYESNTSSASAIKQHFDTQIAEKMRKIKTKKLTICKLDSISIPPSSDGVPHIVNLKQEFTFPSFSTTRRDMSVQTSNVLAFRQKTPHPHGNFRHFESVSRPQSVPTEAMSNHAINEPVKPIYEQIGDGVENNLKQIKRIECEMMNKDLELSGTFPICPSPVQCVLIKPRKHRHSTPSYTCKKNLRPQTRHKKEPITARTESISSSVDEENNNRRISSNANDGAKRAGAGKVQVVEHSLQQQQPPTTRGSDLTTSETSTEAGLDVYGNHFSKLSSVVDKLQDHQWEVCLDGLRSFQSLAAAINWESELGMRFIPIVSRKLIDFFKSPRSNLCRTACQTAGEFFLVAKSTKRPEFDEMVDILMCKSADPNRFIQKDANMALDKMAICINVHHSVRAVCVKGSDHKNPIVRATAARLLTSICKQAGVEQIIGADANPRTRKRILSNLAKFLMDKNVETRRHAEKLARMLKRHKFFMEYFFKETENNVKGTLRKILNNIT